MSVDRGDPEMRIPRNIDDNDQVYGVRTEDIMVGLIPLGTALFISQSLLPEAASGLRVPLLVTGAVIGCLILFFTPPHLTTREWMESIGHHIRRPTEVRHVSYEGDNVREAKDYPDEARAWEVNERAQEITRVRRIHRDVGVLERDDDVMVGAVKVDPANMALASPERWQQMVGEWKNFINHNLDFPIQVYCTTKILPIEDYMSQYQSRASDPDIANRPIMKALLEEFTEWYPEYLSWQGTNQREYYILVTSSEEELRETDVGEKGVFEQAEAIPGLGKYIGSLRASRDERSEREIEAELIQSVEQRCRTVANEGVMPLAGCSADRVTGIELAVMIKEYWQSREAQVDTDESSLRGQPVVTSDLDTTFGTDNVATDGGFATLKSREKRQEEIERIEAEKRRQRVQSNTSNSEADQNMKESNTSVNETDGNNTAAVESDD